MLNRRKFFARKKLKNRNENFAKKRDFGLLYKKYAINTRERKLQIVKSLHKTNDLCNFFVEF